MPTFAFTHDEYDGPEDHRHAMIDAADLDSAKREFLDNEPAPGLYLIDELGYIPWRGGKDAGTIEVEPACQE